MEFTLSYRGPLKASADPSDKHELRRHFHRQLRELWRQPPLSAYQKHYLADPSTAAPKSVIEQHHGFRFAPLVSKALDFVASVRIHILRPEEPGKLLSQAGDLDNRLKALLEALKVPHELNALPSGAVPSEDEDPFFCLLQDDALIVSLAVHTDRLLEPAQKASETLLLVRVRTGAVNSLLSHYDL